MSEALKVFDGKITVEDHATEALIYLSVFSETGDVSCVLLDWTDVDNLIELLQGSMP
jgi:hypothetical protein